MASTNQPGQLDLPQIADYHTLVQAALFDLFANPTNGALVQYAGMALDQVRADALAELEHTSSLSVLACVEATLRIDYAQRVSARGRSALSRELRAVHKQKKDRARLDDDILAAWRDHSGINKNVISLLISAFNYRHWLAHGRYWLPKFGRTYDYQSVYTIADGFLSLMVDVE